MEHMMLLASGAVNPQNTDPYEALSELCTLLAIADEGSVAPLDKIGVTILKQLKANQRSGDVQVMAARALALLLDKFNYSFHVLADTSVAECLRRVFSEVSSHRSSLKFERTTQGELTEELLRCLTLGSSSSRYVQRAMPSPDLQLLFCEGALDGAKWTSCKVLRHCALLARRGSLKKTLHYNRMLQMLHQHLASLCVLDVDFEWDELLRAVTEGFVTLATWCPSFWAAAVSPAQPGSSVSSSKKRPRPISEGHSRGSQESSTVVPERQSVDQLFADLVLRICGSSVADSRKELVLGCANTVLGMQDAEVKLTSMSRRRVLDLLVRLLRETSETIATLGDPFAPKKMVASEVEDGDNFKSLANLQWEVPSMQWSALMLTGKLLGAALSVTAEYIWAWRGDGDMWYWYRSKDRDVLTRGFFAATEKVKTRSGAHSVNFISMTDTHLATKMMARVHFQPVPYVYRYHATPLQLVPSTESETFVGGYGQLHEVRQTLRALSFGSTPVAQIAKRVYAHVVCYGPPSNTEETKTAFRNLVAEHSFTLLESLAKSLIHRNRDWAPILLEAGIADAIAELPEEKRPRVDHSRPTPRRSNSPLRSRSPAQLSMRTSPVAQLIRETSSTMPTPRMQSMMLPASTATTASLVQHLDRANYLELMAFLEASGEVVYSEEQYAAFDKWLQDTSNTSKIVSAVSTFVLRELQKISIDGRRQQLLDSLDSTVAITVCRPERSTGPSCAQGHPLLIHFSTNWQCDKCRQHTGYGSLACRQCNYDLCYQCAETLLRRFESNAAINAADLLCAWRERCVVAKSVEREEEDPPLRSTQSVLYTPQGLIPASLPVRALVGQELHVSTPFGRCECGVATPPACVATAGGLEAEADGGEGIIFHMLRHCGRVILQDAGMSHALLEAFESYGTHFFLDGVKGLPMFLRRTVAVLGPHFSLAMKHSLSRFISVDCRRYALYHIQEAGICLRGAVQADVQSNGLAHKISVKRGDEVAIAQVLQREFSTYPSLRNKVEFFFEGEEGTGNGPTQELYSELSRFYSDVESLWYTRETVRLACPTASALYLDKFFVIGAALGRSFIDGYVMGMELLPQVWGVVRARTDQELVRASSTLLSELEPTLMRSYEYVLQASAEELEELGLEDDQSQPVTRQTAAAYVHSQVRKHLEVCIENIRSMALGLLTSLDISALWFLSNDDLAVLLGGPPHPAGQDAKLFTADQLRSVLLEAHGYVSGCPEVERFIAIVGTEFNRELQTYFVEFLTGSTRLPINGLSGLGRKITVVRKDMEGTGERTLPSCNTCFLYFKLPPYSTSEIMRARLQLAITEGRKNFSLS